MKEIAIIGDAVCADYVPVVQCAMKGEAAVWSPPLPVSSTFQLLEGLGDWALKRQPDVVFLASGMADTRRLCVGDDERLTPLDVFGRNVRCILRLLRERSTAIPVWATITPVDRRRVAAEERSGEFGYDNDTISLYNEEAKEAAKACEVRVLDLYGYVKAAARADSRRPHGIRFDERGSDYIALKVVKTLRACLG